MTSTFRNDGLTFSDLFLVQTSKLNSCLSLQGPPSLPPKRAQVQLSHVPTVGARNHADVQEDFRRDHRHRKQAEK